MKSKIILLFCFKLCLGICPCGYFGPNCNYFYNNSLLKDSDFEFFAYDFPEIKTFDNRDCFVNFDGTVSCFCKEEYKCVLNRCLNFTCKDLGRCVLLQETPVCVCGSIENKNNVTCNQSACISALFVPQPYCSQQGTCVSENNGDLKCVCESESYSGKYCEKMTNLCESNFCLNGGTCIKTSISDFCCICPLEYFGKSCEFKMNSETKEISSIGDTVESRITFGTKIFTSVIEESLDFSSSTESNVMNSLNNNPVSSSPKLSFLNSAPTQKFSMVTSANYLANFQTIEDLCDPNPCKNNASCINLSDGFQCICPIFFDGLFCELEEDDCSEKNNPCLNNSTCINYLGIGNYGCECDHIFIGKNCEYIRNLCENQPCLNEGSCSFNEKKLEYSCFCLEGFYGINCEKKIDSCDSVKCLNGGYCVSKQILFNGTNQDSNLTNLTQHFECICTSYFLGKYCEEEKPDYKKILVVARTIGIASVISIISFFTFVIVMDLSKFLCSRGIL